jgi:hypothetical protein
VKHYRDADVEESVMSTAAAPSPQSGNALAFAFVQQLAAELSKGKVELPSFPDIALRIRKVLADRTPPP